MGASFSTTKLIFDYLERSDPAPSRLTSCRRPCRLLCLEQQDGAVPEVEVDEVLGFCWLSASFLTPFIFGPSC